MFNFSTQNIFMNRKILGLAIPSVISNISIPLLGMVDLALVGHLENIEYIGAVAIGSMIFNFIYWGFSFLRMGTTGLTAQAYGSRNLTESILTLSRSVFIGLGGAMIILSGVNQQQLVVTAAPPLFYKNYFEQV